MSHLTYPLFALGILLLAAVVDLVILRTGVIREPRTWRTLLPLVVMTLVADMLLTALPIVRYDASRISGLHLGTIPIEDFAYVFVAVILTRSIIRFYERAA
ncbi:MAG: lycopene cyclase domain-containing protein [bacterium]